MLLLAVASHGLGASKRLAAWWSAAPAVLKGSYYALVSIAVFLLSTSTERFIYFQF